MAGEVEVIGIDDLVRKFVALGGLTDEEILPALLEGGEMLRDEIKRQIDRQGLVGEGEYKASFAAEISRKVVKVGTDQGFRGWIHEKGGIISRKRARALKFIAGGWKTKQRVSIPARPHVRPALDNVNAPMQTLINERLRVIVRKKLGI